MKRTYILKDLEYSLIHLNTKTTTKQCSITTEIYISKSVSLKD